MHVEHHLIRQDGYHWHVVTSGPQSAPPVLLLHCWSGNWQLWEKTMAHLDGQYRFIVPDHLGFGQSAKPRGNHYRIDEQATRSLMILKYFGYDAAYVVGHSMGGHIALTLAGMYPKNVTRLLVIDPAVTGKVHPLAHVGTPLLLLARFGITWPLIAAIRVGMRFPEVGIQLLRTYFPRPRQQRDAALYWGGRMIADGQAASGAWAAKAVWRWDATPLLSRITAPTLAIWGIKDWNVPVSECTVLEANIKDFRAVCIPQVGHFPMIEAWDAYIKQVERFLQEVLAGQAVA